MNVTQGDDIKTQDAAQERLRRVLLLFTAVLLVFGLYAVLEPFIVPIGWAAILALAGWPLHRRLLRLMPRRPGIAAMTTVVIFAVLIVGPAASIGSALFSEIQTAIAGAKAWFAQERPELPEWIRNIPDFGPAAQSQLDELKKGDAWAVMKESILKMAPVARDVASIMGKGLVHLVFCLFAAYFLFRYGAQVAVQVQRVAIKLGGARFEALLMAVKGTIKGAVYGTVVTAFAQAILAGAGFFFAGTPVPLLFGLATFVFAFIPFGPPFIYLPLSAVIVFNGAPLWHGILLALWGVGAVSTADNILRPLFISQRTQLPLLLVFFGVLGGVAAMGLIGVFIGPAIIAVAHVLWNEWAQPNVPPTTTEIRILDPD
jgi:predicted PurR-regulated permease PerM